MLSRLLKPPSKDTKRKGSKDDPKDTSYHRVRQEDLASPRTPRSPRLERGRNMRWHLVELDKFQDIPRRSVSSYSVTSSDSPRLRPLTPTLSEPNCLQYLDKRGSKESLPLLESSPESASLSHAHHSPQFRQQRTSDECDDDNLSSEYSAGSSAGSPPKSAEAVKIGWGASEGLNTDVASSFTPKARKKAVTPRRLQQANGFLDKIKTVQNCPTAQERIEEDRPRNQLPGAPDRPKSPLKKELESPLVSPPTPNAVGPIPVNSKRAQRNLSGPLWVQDGKDLGSQQGLGKPSNSPHTSDMAKPISKGNKGVHNNLSGPLCVQRKRDQSPHQSHKDPLTSRPYKSDLARPVSSVNTGIHTNLSGPLRVPRKRNQSPHSKSPLQSPFSSPQRNRGGILPTHPDFRLGLHDDVQIAHPLPLPWALTTPSLSPRSNTSSADRSEESVRGDRGDTSMMLSSKGAMGPSGGKWLKGALLGSGSFGKVYRGHHSETGDMCAIKEVEIVAGDPRSKECAKQLAQEIALLSMLRHPNILHYKGSEMVGESLYIYLELVSGGSIYRLLQEFNNSFTEPVIRRYTRQILLGLDFLHAKCTVHRDIKCANILVDQDGRIKLADFGMAKLIGNETAPLSFKGSPYWMAPEVILQNNTGFECALDIWSLGCTVIEMTTGKPPWFQYEGFAAMFKVMNCHEVPIPSSLSPFGQNFVSVCLQRDPAKRPTAAALLEHPFVQVDQEPSFLVQSVSDSLCRDMMRDRVPKGSEYRFGTPPRMASRDPAASSGALSPRPRQPSPIHTSKSDVQVSYHAKPRPGKELWRLGGLTDTELHTHQSKRLPMNNHGD